MAERVVPLSPAAIAYRERHLRGLLAKRSTPALAWLLVRVWADVTARRVRLALGV